MKKKAKKVNKKTEVVELKKRGRGRPRKVIQPEPPVAVKRKRGRPPKVVLAPQVVVTKAKPKNKPQESKPAVAKTIKKQVTPSNSTEFKISSHELYGAAVWLLSKLPHHEDEYIKKMARKRGTTPLNTIMEHMLDFFGVKNTEIGQLLKETHKPQ